MYSAGLAQALGNQESSHVFGRTVKHSDRLKALIASLASITRSYVALSETVGIDELEAMGARGSAK
jgi:hypothetical protein